jgi:hypothetical protein
MLAGEVELLRKAEGGLLLPTTPSGHVATSVPNGTAATVRVLGPSDHALPAPQMSAEDDATLADRLQQLAMPAPSAAIAATQATTPTTTRKAGGTPARSRTAGGVGTPMLAAAGGGRRAGSGAGAGRPTAESVALMLTQALRVDDRALLEQCLAIQDPTVVRGSVRRIPTPYILPFLRAVRSRSLLLLLLLLLFLVGLPESGVCVCGCLCQPAFVWMHACCVCVGAVWLTGVGGRPPSS